MGFLSISCRITRDFARDPTRSHHPKGGTESRVTRSLERVNETFFHLSFRDVAGRGRTDAAAAARGRGGGRGPARGAGRGPGPVVAARGRSLLKHVNISLRT